MNTDFQRHDDPWDNRKMSLLIESTLLRSPLPALYFDASKDDNWLTVDDLQRLSPNTLLSVLSRCTTVLII
ncbi:hypothetical protein HBA55_02320 [Pseudomaricurvus alkylphenolicus]|uniref:DUF262 domain-containing protein n=1 Tax=Pseudomaricurvus alkylphenolicus TaxID=1306991 RepID=UPI0014203D14|nr:DUF262 domain-containing protein [Pseudomaricurvus alkylphenolicus]NIB38399.1 hypothetical protein [Pseudomaricurvus alkylphenolicus]